MRSASLGPPNRAAIASGLREDWGAGGCEVGSSLLAAELETDHFKRSLSLGSMMGGCCCCGR
jgi:hypothetical protein